MSKKTIESLPVDHLKSKREVLREIEKLMKEYRSKICVRCRSIFYGDGNYCVSCNRENKINEIFADQ